MKKFFALLLALAMVLSLAACGGSTGASSGSGTLRLINGKIEVDEQLKKLAAKYEEETGVKVEIETRGGGDDNKNAIKEMQEAGNMPDLFVCNAGEFAEWDGVLADLSDEAWVADTDAAWKDADGKVYGFPYTTEAIGLAYNADLLERAGVDPASIVDLPSMQAAFESLDARKDELGLTAVIGYCAEPKDMYWSTGDHLFGVYIDAGTAIDEYTYIDMLNDGGKLDEARFTDFANMVALFNQYSDPDLLVSGTYDQQVLNFASGKYAFMTQGSWAGAAMVNNDADAYSGAGSFRCGMIPYAFQSGIDSIMIGCPSWWAVNDGDNAQAAKDFLNWCAGETAQEILVKDAGFVSPFRSCIFVADDPFAQVIADYLVAGKTSPWHWEQKERDIRHELGKLFGEFAAGDIRTPEEFVAAVQEQTASSYAE